MREAFEAGNGRFEFLRGHTDKGVFALFLALLLINIGTRANPHRNGTPRVTHGDGPAHVPAIHSIRAQETMFKVERFACINRILPALHVFFYIVRVNKLRPSPASNLFKRETGELGPLRVEVIYLSVWLGCEDLLRHGLGQKTETRLAFH